MFRDEQRPVMDASRPPPHISEVRRPWTGYQRTFAVVCAAMYVLNGTYFAIQRYEFSTQRCSCIDAHPLTWCACWLPPALFAASFFTGRLRLIAAAAGLLALDVIWVLSALCQL